MFTVLKLVGEVLKSNLVTGIINALIADTAVPAPNDAITKTVSTAAVNTNVCDAAHSVVSAIVPQLKTWTPAELAAAEAAWAAQQDPGAISANAAFAAGVAWALAHQTSTLTTGIANAVASATVDAVQAVEAHAQASAPGTSGDATKA